MTADYGVDVYGNAIIVNPKFATDHPDAVKGFLRAFVKSLKSTAKDPAAAVDSVVDKAIDQIALTYAFKARPRSGDIFDSSSLPAAADRLID
jgi:NitT/TauT family transport system substrate-binding protein